MYIFIYFSVWLEVEFFIYDTSLNQYKIKILQYNLKYLKNLMET